MRPRGRPLTGIGKGKQVRPCLRCGTPFRSNSPGNRLCYGCKLKTKIGRQARGGL